MNYSGQIKGKEKDLELILQNTEPDQKVISTVLEIYSAIQGAKEKYFDSSNPGVYAKRHGMLVYTNYDPKTSELKINGWQSKPLEGYYIHNPQGKEKIKELLHQDGAIEVNAYTGKIESYHRHIHVDPEEVALERKVIRHGEKISSEKMGFDEKTRRKLCGDEDYEGVGTKHQTALAATAKDPSIYALVLSEETGAITVMKDYKILFSTIPSEIYPAYLQYLASNRGNPTENISSVKGADVTYHTVHEARERPRISAEEALRMQIAILHELKTTNGHYI